MNIVSRFNMGKRLNLVQRGSYQRRVYLAGLRYNKQFNWHYSPYKRATKTSPGKYFEKFVRKGTRKQHLSTRKRLFPSAEHENKNNKKRKLNIKVNADYGPNAEMPEMESDTLKMECEFLLQKLKVINFNNLTDLMLWSTMK